MNWEEEVKFNIGTDTGEEEKESIEHCKTSYYTDYKYNIFYEVGKEFTDLENQDSNLYNLIDKNNYYPQLLFAEIEKAADDEVESNDSGTYLREIGLFFFFVGCAGISIIVWVFNWICWLNQCCCCDFLHNPVNKRISWWTSFTFLLGVLACCISGFVTVKRFGFALEGSRCAYDRIYYDVLYGQLKYNMPRWEGIKYINEIIKLKFNLQNDEGLKTMNIPIEKDFTDVRNKIFFMDYLHKKENLLRDSLNILAMIYFCLFLIAVVAAGVSMMFYACLKRQGYLITLMHILWNIIRFFIFSFFLYGTAYGIIFIILSDLIGVMKIIFTEEKPKFPIVSKFFEDCLSENKIFSGYTVDQVKNCFDTCNDVSNKRICKKGTNEFFNLDCSFLESDLNHLYKVLNDASMESQKLSAISLCAAFFGAVAIYFYLLVMHHYNNELFFDSGKSIFTGFDGFGRGYKNKNRNNDPAYKKRKLRAEIELTSKNDEQNEYKDINKNDDD